MQKILDYWISLQYSKSVREFIQGWALGVVKKVVHGKAALIIQLSILRTMGHVVDECFFLLFSLSEITHKLCDHAPRMFELFDAFSTTMRQEWEMRDIGFERKELVSVTLCMLHIRGQIKLTFLLVKRSGSADTVERDEWMQQLSWNGGRHLHDSNRCLVAALQCSSIDGSVCWIQQHYWNGRSSSYCCRQSEWVSVHAPQVILSRRDLGEHFVGGFAETSWSHGWKKSWGSTSCCTECTRASVRRDILGSLHAWFGAASRRQRTSVSARSRERAYLFSCADRGTRRHRCCHVSLGLAGSRGARSINTGRSPRNDMDTRPLMLTLPSLLPNSTSCHSHRVVCCCIWQHQPDVSCCRANPG